MREAVSRGASFVLVVGSAAALLTLPPAPPPTTLAQAATPYVTLAERAVLPADSFAPGPPSGAAITGNTNGRSVPFASPPVQGISAVVPLGGSAYLVLSDNGYGSKANSADYRLRWYAVTPDWSAGNVEVAGYTELRDPDGRVPFPIVNGASDRVLTGADFDPESFRQAPDGTFWVGDEFGPYLLHLDAEGRLLDAPIPTPYPQELAPFARGLPFVQSPDHPDFAGLPDQDARRRAANLPSSRGFEGMALNASGTRLYPLLEGALTDDPDQTRLLLHEFDLTTQSYTGNYWFYPLSETGHAIGELTALSDDQFLVIERDSKEGNEAVYKRLYTIDLRSREAGQVLEKRLVADLMQIGDVRGLTSPEAGAVGLGEVFKFPFTTIESVYPVGDRTLLVINDNNYPFSTGRRPGLAPDDSEFILIRLNEGL
jgi:hypothetical protein